MFVDFLGIFQPKQNVFGSEGAAINAHVPPAQAPTVKPRLAMLLICRLASLDILEGFYQPGGEATFQQPRETTFLQTILQIEPIEVWAINTQTGEIYSK